MTTNHAELCERLRQASIQCSDCGMYETSSDFDLAVSMIESQAARIQQQALECVSLFDQCSEHLGRIAELEKERDTLKSDAERWRIIEFTLPTDEIQDIAIIVAAEHSVNVANGFAKAPADLLDAAVAALQAEKETRS